MPDLATLQARKTEAEDAYHRLRLGEKDVEVTMANGTKIRLNEANPDKLKNYIADLEDEIRKAGGGRSRAPIHLTL